MAKDNISVTIDFSPFEKVLDRLSKVVDHFSMDALQDMGDELLRESAKEVPHKDGILQDTGRSEPKGNDTVEVGYHTPYAARLHEHPEYKFRGGKKGKYLEDPLKRNLGRWLSVYAEGLKGMF